MRELNVYCEIYPWNKPESDVLAHHPKGLILSGGPNSVYEPGAPTLARYITRSDRPILGLCYGMQLLAHSLGGAKSIAGLAADRPAGLRGVVVMSSFDPGETLATIERFGVQGMVGVPAMFLFMSQHPAFGETDLSSV